MKKIILYAVILTATLVACNNNNFVAEDNTITMPEEISAVEEIYLADPEAGALRSFGKALYTAMSESPMLREIIKVEAMKQFNKDYDVLYQLIKNKEVENGLTVRNLLLRYFEDEATLTRIEARCPTLTIFVPKLPEDSFSADTWNTAEQIPAVAIRAKHHSVPIISEYGFFDENSDEFVVEGCYIPAFPVVVLKQNERVRVARDRVQTQSAILNSAGSDFVFEFVDDVFDGSKTENTVQRAVLSGEVDQKVIDAYTIYQNTDGWQRDYIYYGLTPSNTTGPFCYDFQEKVTSFRFSNSVTPAQILAKISDAANDPKFVIAFWTDGSFEFNITAEIGTTGIPSSTMTVAFFANPEDLFEVTYNSGGFLFTSTITGFKTISINSPLMKWNLANYAPAIKLSICEFDLSETITSTSSSTIEFAGNIEYNMIKIGLKFGASGKYTHNSTFTRVIYTGSDALGDVLIDFADKVVLSNTVKVLPLILGGGTISIYNIREYDNGVYVITMEPKRVQ